jgi:hypothetical protein
MWRSIQLSLLIGTLGLPLCATLAQTPGPAPGEPRADPGELPWLDEVRAQREAWEARRKAEKEASDARLRMIDPWGAAHMEAHEREAEARRDAALQRAEQRHKKAEAKKEAQRQARERWLEERTRIMHPAIPPDWDNPWYYRGY